MVANQNPQVETGEEKGPNQSVSLHQTTASIVTNMSVPPTPQWQHCADGFAGVDKFRRLLPSGDRGTLGKARMASSVGGKIFTDTAPEEKSKIAADTRHKLDVSSVAWKQGDFLQDFDTNKGLISPTEDITWSTSSSDECSPVARCPEVRKRVRRESGHRKKKRLSTQAVDFPETAGPTPSQLSVSNTQSPTHQTTATFTSGDPVYASQRGSGGQYAVIDIVSSPGSHLSTSAHNVSPVRSATQSSLCHRAREKPSKVAWTLSSFDDIKHMSSSTKDTLPVTWSRQPKLTHGSFSRCRRLGARVQRSWAGESQESVGEISDVESDTEPEPADLDGDIVGSDIETTSSHTTSAGDQQQPAVSLPASLLEDEQQQSVPVDISSGTTSSSSSSHSEKIRASDWVRALQTHKTPEKVDPSLNCQQDSAKKGRKCVRGSLGEQLTRLITREKASVRFWQHSVKTGTFCDTSSRSLLLRLESLEKQYSLFLSRCHLMVEDGGTKPCRALFASETVQMLSLKPGMLVQVFAPWQQLEEDGGLQTYLCTHYVRICPGDSQQPAPAPAGVPHRTVTSAVWRCPCSTDPHLPSQACQASVCPVLPLQIGQLKPASDSSGCSVRHSATLHTVAALPDHPAVSLEPKRTLLESLERVGADSSLLPPFTATVLRVFRHRGADTWKHRFQLLVEDAAGSLAIIRLADDSTDVHQGVYQAEGQTYTFSHLQLVSRTNKDKEPALFRIIEELWTGQFVDTVSQHSENDASQIQVHVAAPGFAYVLRSVSAVACMSLDPGCAPKEASVRLINVKEALQLVPESRVSFVARVLLPVGFSQCHRQQAGEPSAVFVYDASVQLAGGSTAVQRLELGRECVLETSSSGVCLFRDVRVHQGHMQCDGYTLVVDKTAWSTWSLCSKMDSCIAGDWTVTLPPVSDMSQINSLVSLQGVVSGVDEDESYSWEECPTCGSDRLATLEETGTVYCTGCNSQVMSPVTRMKMKVCVTCKNCLSPDLQVQLELAQATIDSLLPSELSDEGLDTQQVVGKPIDCPACVVLGRVCDPSTDAGRHPRLSLLLMELTQ